MKHLEHVLPFYVVCDVSLSMMDHMDALNEGLLQLIQAVTHDPVVADRTRLCLIGFAGSAEILQPLSPLAGLAGHKRLPADATTNFGAAFALLRETIPRDLESLKKQRRTVHRPAVFFMSDGHPTDKSTWPAVFAALTDPSWSARPNMIAFGLGDADPATIARIGTFRAFMRQDGVTPGAALHQFTRALTASIVSSTGETDVALTVPGFVPLRIDTT